MHGDGRVRLGFVREEESEAMVDLIGMERERESGRVLLGLVLTQ